MRSARPLVIPPRLKIEQLKDRQIRSLIGPAKFLGFEFNDGIGTLIGWLHLHSTANEGRRPLLA